MQRRTLLALLLVSLVIVAPQARAQESETPELPQNVAQWLNFQPVSVQQLKGKGVVLYFFEEGCPRCKERWPELLQTAKKYQGLPVMFIAVNSGSSAKAVAAYTREVGVSWPVIVDQDRTLEKEFSVPEVSLQNIYQTVVVTPQGNIQKMGGDFSRAAEMAAQGAAWKVDPTNVPADLKQAWLGVELGKYAQAGPIIRKSLSSANPEVKAAAEALNAAVQKEIDAKLTEAQQLVSQDRQWEAFKICHEIDNQYQGFPVPDEVTELEQTLAKDPAVLAEQKAATALETARKTGSKGSAAAIRRATVMLQKIVEESPDTEAAAEAQAILNKLPN